VTFSGLRGRVTLGRIGVSPVVLVTLVIASLAWLALVGRLVPMPGSRTTAGTAPMDVTAPGVPEAMGTASGVGGVALYLLMWSVMMVAMMYPPSVGVFGWYATRREGTRPPSVSSVVAFVGGYTLLWTLVGLIPLAVNAVVPISSVATTWGSLYFGVGLLAVAAFQFSPLKRRYLRRCRSPSRAVERGSRPGVRNAARLGWTVGRQDFGSCGVLMGLMVVMGSMNVGWMALVTAVLLLERLTAHGYRWAKVVGLLAAAGGFGLVLTGIV
jgi:predicted metal-binding membrane protein